MSKSDFWTFNILIFTGLIILFLSISSFIPPFFAIFGALSLAAGVRIGFRSEEILEQELILDDQEKLIEDNQEKSSRVFQNQEISIKDTQDNSNKSSVVARSLINSIRQSKSKAFEIKPAAIEIKNEDEKPEVIVVPKEEKKPVVLAIPKEDNKLEKQSKEVVSFLWGGGFGPLGWMKNKILSKEQVVEKWSILIQQANGKAEDILKSTEFFLKDSKAPNLRIERRKMMPGFIRGMFGTKREFLVVADKNFKLKPYQIFINARDYGNNLDVSWYMTYRLPFWRAFVYFFIPGGGGKFAGPDGLDLFDQQDLTAYLTVCHHSTLDAVENLMLGLGQDTSRIDRKSRGFFGIS